MGRWGAYATPSTTILVSPPAEKYLLKSTHMLSREKVYLHEEVDDRRTPASCHLTPLTVYKLSLSPSRTGAQVLMLYTHAIARVTHDLAEMPD